MKISLLTDAPKHNLALMKLSTYYKSKGDNIVLNMPFVKADIICASWLFENGLTEYSDLTGGIGFDPRIRLLKHIEKLKPDYGLFGLNHSLGYTFRACFRKCPFCKVPLLPKDTTHHSIREFHDPEFDTIELLNNNTFFDPLWEDTFREIRDAKLRVIEHGMDIRLLDDHKAWWIKKLRWAKQPKFAWDRMRNEKKIIEGLKLLQKYKVRAMVYVLMGFDTNMQENIYRCQKIHDFGCDPFPMLYRPTEQLHQFRRMIYLRCYRKYPTIKTAWHRYTKEMRRKANKRR